MKILTLSFLICGSLFAAIRPVRVQIHEQKIVRTLQRSLRRELPHGIKISIENVSIPPRVPSDASLLIMSPHPPLGVVSLQFAWSDGLQLKRTYGSAVVRGSAKIAVAQRAIRFNEPLTSENVRFEEHELSPYLTSGYFLKASDLIRRKTSGYVRPGAILGQNNTQIPADISAGDVVELLSQRGNIRITARMKALEMGRYSEVIRVQNPLSKKVIQARVIGPDRAELP